KWATDESSASCKARTSMPTATMPTATAVPTTTAEPRLRRRRNQYGANYAHHYERGQILVSHGIAPAWERITPSQTNESARRFIPVRVDQDFVTVRRRLSRPNVATLPPISAIFAVIRSWTWLAIYHSL